MLLNAPAQQRIVVANSWGCIGCCCHSSNGGGAEAPTAGAQLRPPGLVLLARLLLPRPLPAA